MIWGVIIPLVQVVNVTLATWDRTVTNSGQRLFVKFYAPWCPKCQELRSIWESLGQNYDEDTDVRLARVDCTEETTLCEMYNIDSYPKFKLFWKELEEDYTGGTDILTLKKFTETLKPVCEVTSKQFCSKKHKVYFTPIFNEV